MAAFTKVSVPLVYVDLNTNPLKSTAASIDITARAIGAEQKAAEFVDFYRHRVERITDRLKTPGLRRPKLLIMAHGPGVRCCFASPDRGVTTYFGGLGVANIAAGVGSSSSGPATQLSLEYVIESDPEIFVANIARQGPGSLVGEPRSRAHAAASLEKLRLEPGLSDLSAMLSAVCMPSTSRCWFRR